MDLFIKIYLWFKMLTMNMVCKKISYLCFVVFYIVTYIKPLSEALEEKPSVNVITCMRLSGLLEPTFDRGLLID